MPSTFRPVFRILLLPIVFALTLAAQLSAQGVEVSSTQRPLMAGDVIEVFHWRDSLISGEYAVDERGRVLLPMIGTWTVTGTPWPVLRDSILLAYTRELREDAVQLTPKRRVLVLGFVRQPGPYLVEPTISLAGAIALAGGASAEGNLQRVRVLREGAVLLDRTSIESPRIAEPVQSGDQIFVDRRGWFDRNSPFFVSALVGLAGIVVTLIVAR
jgi:protein involved in polysaccharide export with SLBB domain